MRFAAVGVSNTVLDMGVLALLSGALCARRRSAERMLAGGELRYIYWGGQGGGPGFGAGQSSISSWVSRNCTAVTGYETQTQNAGAPDGTAPGGGFGNLRVTLYDCKPAN